MKIYASAGKGGDGVVRWLHEKGKEFGGPAGGDGGRGGDVYARAVRDVYVLAKYRHDKNFLAENGGSGESKSMHGKNGDDKFIDLPIGTLITNLETSKTYELLEDGEKVLLLTGGKGGYGNEFFKSSIHTTPKKWTPGKDGEEGHFQIELQLFADIGLVGLPNAGKSSLLNVLTNSVAKVGSYQFTTLDPNLGAFYGHIIADIPGIIEGASEGKGLGVKFLKHIKRTKMLAHLISFENDEMLKTYKTIRKELEKYDKELALNQPKGLVGRLDLQDKSNLAEKDEIIILTKTDMADAKTVEKTIKEFKKFIRTSKRGGPIFTISLFDDKSIKVFSDELTEILRESTPVAGSTKGEEK